MENEIKIIIGEKMKTISDCRYRKWNDVLTEIKKFIIQTIDKKQWAKDEYPLYRIDKYGKITRIKNK